MLTSSPLASHRVKLSDIMDTPARNIKLPQRTDTFLVFSEFLLGGTAKIQVWHSYIRKVWEPTLTWVPQLSPLHVQWHVPHLPISATAPSQECGLNSVQRFKNSCKTRLCIPVLTTHYLLLQHKKILFFREKACSFATAWCFRRCYSLDFKWAQEQPRLRPRRCRLWRLDGKQPRKHLVIKTQDP